MSHSVVLFWSSTQQFGKLIVGCKSVSRRDRASQEGQRGKTCRKHHKDFNVKNKLSFRSMSQRDQRFQLSQFWQPSKSHQSFLDFSSGSLSFLCNQSNTAALLATLQPNTAHDFHKTNVRKKKRQRAKERERARERRRAKCRLY